MRQVYATCFAVVKNHFDAYDAPQKTFIAAHRSLPRFRGDSSFKTWLLAIAINQSRDIARHRRDNPVPEPGFDPPDPGEDGLSRLITREQKDGIRRVLAALPEKQRLSVLLLINRGLSFKEIAQVLGTSEGAAKTSCHYGFIKIVDNLRVAPGVKRGKKER